MYEFISLIAYLDNVWVFWIELKDIQTFYKNKIENKNILFTLFNLLIWNKFGMNKLT